MIQTGVPIRLGSEEHRMWLGALIAKYPADHFVTIDEPSRSLDSNARFHAMLGDIVKYGYEHFGRKLTIEEWKVLFVTEWMNETGQASDIAPTLYGTSFVQLRKSTRKMTGRQLGEVMIIVERWCSEKGVPLREEPT